RHHTRSTTSSLPYSSSSALTSTPFPYTTLFRSLAPRTWPAGVTAAGRSHGGRQESQRPAGVTAAGRRHSGRQESQRPDAARQFRDRKSTRLNSSHVSISYAVSCFQKTRYQKVRL